MAEPTVSATLAECLAPGLSQIPVALAGRIGPKPDVARDMRAEMRICPWQARPAPRKRGQKGKDGAPCTVFGDKLVQERERGAGRGVRGVKRQDHDGLRPDRRGCARAAKRAAKRGAPGRRSGALDQTGKRGGRGGRAVVRSGPADIAGQADVNGPVGEGGVIIRHVRLLLCGRFGCGFDTSSRQSDKARNCNPQ